MPPDVTAQLLKPGLDDLELFDLLCLRLSRAQFTSSTRVDLGDPDNPAITLHYSRAGSITRIDSMLPVSELASVELEIVEKLVHTQGVKTGQQIVFCSMPVLGKWEGPDYSIVEAPPDAPRPPWQIGDYPAMIEFPVEVSSDQSTTAWRVRRIATDHLLMLSLFVPHIRPLSGRARTHWGVALGTGEDLRHSPQWFQESYGYDGFQIAIDEPRAPQFESRIGMTPDSEYYHGRRGVSSGDALTFPESLESWLIHSSRLGAPTQRRLRRAAYWLQHSREAWDYSLSASFISTVQAVEAVLPNLRAELCPQCGRNTGPGPTRQFREFMERFAPPSNEVERKTQSEIYRRRSQLTHGHELLATDIEIHFGLSSPVAAAEDVLVRYAAQAARIAIINWCLSQNS